MEVARMSHSATQDAYCKPCWERAARKMPLYRLGMCESCFSGRPVRDGEQFGEGDWQNREKVAAGKRRYYAQNREKVAAGKRRYYEQNREKVAAGQRRYHEQNREKVAARKRRYHEQNREKVAAGQRRYREQNREKLAARQRRYREQNREKIAAGTVTSPNTRGTNP